MCAAPPGAAMRGRRGGPAAALEPGRPVEPPSSTAYTLPVNEPRLGIAFSGGSLKMLPAIGAVAAFEEAGLRPAAVAGCSMGAVVAGLWKAGYSGREMLEVFKGFSFKHAVYPWQALTGSHQRDYRFGRFSTRRMRRLLFDRHVPRPGGDRQAPFDLYIYAVDLSTGEPVFWPDTELPLGMKEAVLASMSLFPFFTPLQVRDAAGRRHYLVDGGYYSPIPAEVLKERAGCGRVLALYYRDPARPGYEAIRSACQAGRRFRETRWAMAERRGLGYADELLVIPYERPGMAVNPRIAAEAFEVGYRAASRWLEARERSSRG